MIDPLGYLERALDALPADPAAADLDRLADISEGLAHAAIRLRKRLALLALRAGESNGGADLFSLVTERGRVELDHLALLELSDRHENFTAACLQARGINPASPSGRR